MVVSLPGCSSSLGLPGPLVAEIFGVGFLIVNCEDATPSLRCDDPVVVRTFAHRCCQPCRLPTIIFRIFGRKDGPKKELGTAAFCLLTSAPMGDPLSPHSPCEPFSGLPKIRSGHIATGSPGLVFATTKMPFRERHQQRRDVAFVVKGQSHKLRLFRLTIKRHDFTASNGKVTFEQFKYGVSLFTSRAEENTDGVQARLGLT